MPVPRKPRLSQLAAALCAVVLLALTTACGGSSSPASLHTEGGLIDLGIGNFANSALTLPFAVATDQGFFTKAGLNVKMLPGANDNILISALIGGSIQIANGTPSAVMPAMQRGESLLVLPPVGRLNLNIVTPKSSGITSLSGLVGKKIGVTGLGTATEKFVKDVLKANGIDSSKVTIVGVGGVPAQIAAIQHGSVDAEVYSSDTIAVVQDKGIPLRTLVSSLNGTAGDLGNFGMQSFWTTTQTFQTQHPEVVNKFCTAMSNAIDWIKDSANQAAAVKSVEQLVTTNAAVATNIITSMRESWSMQLTAQRWQDNVNWITGSGTNLPYGKAVLANCG